MEKKVKEGYCEVCENYGELEDHDGQFICKECAEEEGLEKEED